MAARKWRNVDFKLGIIKVRETLVDGEEGRPKTASSVRDIKMLPPVIEAFRSSESPLWAKVTTCF
jgi:integrase